MIDATGLLRLHARQRAARLAGQDAVHEQERLLLRLVKQARDTRFGRDHDFRSIDSVAAFQGRVPLRRFEDTWNAYWSDPFPVLDNVSWPGTVPFFAVTSGTTSGRTKHIPLTAAMMAANRRAGLDLYAHHVANRPRSRILAGRSFLLGGSTALVPQAPGVASGDLSGIAVRELPWWARRRYFPPDGISGIADWERKVEAIAVSILREDIRAISGTPSWLLLLFDRLDALNPEAGGRLGAHFPRLEMLVHGGVNFAPYRKRFARLLEDSRAETREVYAASEGYFANADRNDGEGMRLIVDTGQFYEFVVPEALDQENPPRRWLADVETGVNYAIVVSTCAGLWGHVVGDTVTFTDLDPPRILVTGRTAYTLSAFGEHLIEEEIADAVAAAAAAVGGDVSDYAVAPVFPSRPGELGGHAYVLEFADEVPPIDLLGRFAAVLDEALSKANEDYGAHRAGGYGLDAPRIHGVPPGTFAAWMKRRDQLGGQHKVPRIINDSRLFHDLMNFVRDVALGPIRKS